MNRRRLLSGATAGAFAAALPFHAYGQGDEFSRILANLKENEDLSRDAAAFREFALEGEGVECLNIEVDGKEICIVTAARRPPRLTPSSLSISQDAKDLIIYAEVTSKKRYEKDLILPILPGGQSGITIGIGYDLGYVSSSDFRAEWKEYIHQFTVEALSAVCGKKGQSAQDVLSSVSQIRIGWDAAQRQFSEVLLPIFVAQTEQFAPTISKLHPDCRGALVSLIFNRGTALSLKNDSQDSRKEMREIVALMKTEDYKSIPLQFESMTRLWEGRPKVRGVVLRRRAEAALFARGLKATG